MVPVSRRFRHVGKDSEITYVISHNLQTGSMSRPTRYSRLVPISKKGTLRLAERATKLAWLKLDLR